MTTVTAPRSHWPWRPADLSVGECEELRALGILTDGGQWQPRPLSPAETNHTPEKHAISAPQVLNEAYRYGLPSSFTRGLRVGWPGATLLLISGTASVDEQGATTHPGDFRAQCWRTYRNITELLTAEGATWHHIVRCTCYLRDIERDYDEFNRVRTAFFDWLRLSPLPASTGIQARLCRSDLLIEIEAMALIPDGNGKR